MKNLFVPYKLALIARKKGFNERCLACINSKEQIEIGNTSHLMAWIHENKKDEFAPLYQQIVDWFRENHKLEIQVLTLKYTFKGTTSYKHSLKVYEEQTYYSALTKAIEEAFKLI